MVTGLPQTALLGAALLALLALLVPAAHGGAPSTPQAGTHRAVRSTALDPAACVRIATGEAQADEAGCPGFARAAAAVALEVCREVGGRLRGAAHPDLQSLDVDGDGRPEYLFDYTGNFDCDGAPSLFSCGSLGCPTVIYQQRRGAWRSIGAVGAEDAPALEVLTPASGQRYGQRYGRLRGGCLGERPCDELAYFDWSGENYAVTALDVGGRWVDVKPELNGLWTPLRDYVVRATPAADGEVLDRYPASQEVAVLGEARGAAFLYVAPCNACRHGFVEKSLLRKVP